MSGRPARPAIERGYRLGLAALLCVVCAVSVAATSDPQAALLACRDLKDGVARLACFDRESAALVALAATPALAPEQTFGLSPVAIVERESVAAQRPELAEVQARLVGIGLGMDGRSELTLDNGQVWRQLSPDEELLIKTGDIVTLSRGVLGSYWLTAPSGRGCKVRRIR
jgi:hypothetical protein